MAVVAESSDSLQTDKCPSIGPVSNKIFCVDLFSRINYPLTAKYVIAKLVAK